MSGAPGQEPARRRRVPKQIRWTVSAFLVALVVEYLVVPQLGGVRQSLYRLGRVNVAYLILGVGLEFAALVAYAQLTHTVLPAGGPSRWRLLRINTSSLALSHVVPGGTAAATGLSYRLLTKSGVQGADVAFGLAMQGVGSAVVLNLIFWVALIISIFLRGYNPIYGVAAGVGVLLMGAFAGVVLLLLRGQHRAVGVVRSIGNHIPFVTGDQLASVVERIAERLRALLDDRELLRRAIVWAAANWLLDAASLWVFLIAFGKVLGPVELLVAYGLANVLAVIPITPGGLVIVETVLITTVTGFGAPRSIATLGVLTYRAANFWLPIPAGFLTYLSLRFSGETWRSRLRHARDEATAGDGAAGVEGLGPGIDEAPLPGPDGADRGDEDEGGGKRASAG
ncbi:MAG: UPF0104 family protein [Acidobacteriota bacterium]|nr:UPF0104 family protein [Acidobacteriota bacterium]